MQMCLTAGASSLSVKSDSQLIVGQVLEGFEAKEDGMKMYLSKVKEDIAKLKHFEIKHIPRSENQLAEALARLASSAE